MVSLQRIITATVSGFSREDKYFLLKTLFELACADSHYDLIEKIGIESIAAVLFPEADEETAILKDLEGGVPGVPVSEPEKQSLILEVLCFTALMDDDIHPEEVRFIRDIASGWGIGLEQIRRMPCFDPIRLLEYGLAESGEVLLEELRKAGV